MILSCLISQRIFEKEEMILYDEITHAETEWSVFYLRGQLSINLDMFMSKAKTNKHKPPLYGCWESRKELEVKELVAKQKVVVRWQM